MAGQAIENLLSERSDSRGSSRIAALRRHICTLLSRPLTIRFDDAILDVAASGSRRLNHRTPLEVAFTAAPPYERSARGANHGWPSPPDRGRRTSENDCPSRSQSDGRLERGASIPA